MSVKICSEPYTSVLPEFEKYTYPLSDFQKYAIDAILQGHHVLSCAHTGSGKTLAAEFAIQHFVNIGKKVIYTSPIKALSNQKYYEFSHKYPNISFGLLTGDIKTNPGADVLIMTTEILMNKLFIGSSVQTATNFEMDFQNELACVVFDEVHYINDVDRGNVWEQSIMLLPDNVQMIMLSATIDNPTGFAQWVANCHSESNKQVWLASTNHRVVPLTHYVYYTTTEDPFKKIKDKTVQEKIRNGTNRLIPILDTKFNPVAYNTISQLDNLFNKERIFIKRKHVLNSVVQMMRDNEKSVYADSEKEMLPAIFFVFSRKLVEDCAKEITVPVLEFDNKTAYTMRHDCEQIVRKFPNAREYLELPEFNQLVSLLEKGIAIHHSGMIPVLREIVELMISQKRVKVLFATESFAIGLDCPIRTAVFMSLTKYTTDGLRYLQSHEYTQMAGRAGRRGIDTIGNVIHLNNLFRELPTVEEYKQILCGKPQTLASKFVITPQIVLNQMKHGNHTVEQMMKHIQKTMLAGEHRILLESMQERLVSQQKEYDNCFAKDGLAQDWFVKADLDDICKRYLALKEKIQIPLLNAKSRKETEKNIQEIQKQNANIEKDCEIYAKRIRAKKAIDETIAQISDLTERLHKQVEDACNQLCEKGILSNDGNVYNITDKGIPVLYVAEIDPITVFKLIDRTEWFSNYTATEFTKLFSCFTNIKVDDEYKRPIPIGSVLHLCTFKTPKGSPRTSRGFATLSADLSGEGDADCALKMRNGVYEDDSLDELHYDLYEEMGKWCGLETELDCKIFIQNDLAEKGISIGDFTKAVLKIATISREWASMCEISGHIDVQNELVKVEGLVLKYITTSQSLYI